MDNEYRLKVAWSSIMETTRHCTAINRSTYSITPVDCMCTRAVACSITSPCGPGHKINSAWSMGSPLDISPRHLSYVTLTVGAWPCNTMSHPLPIIQVIPMVHCVACRPE